MVDVELVAATVPITFAFTPVVPPVIILFKKLVLYVSTSNVLCAELTFM